MMNKLPGKRTLKTAMSVFLCILVMQSIEFILRKNNVNIPNSYNLGFYSAIAAVFTMDSDVIYSKKKGVHRIIGTIIGGIIGMIFFGIYGLVIKFSGINSQMLLIILKCILLFLGIIITIHICHIFGVKIGVNVSCIIVIGIMLMRYKGYPEDIIGILIRIFETILGVEVAYLINKNIFPPKK